MTKPFHATVYDIVFDLFKHSNVPPEFWNEFCPYYLKCNPLKQMELLDAFESSGLNRSEIEYYIALYRYLTDGEHRSRMNYIIFRGLYG